MDMSPPKGQTVWLNRTTRPFPDKNSRSQRGKLFGMVMPTPWGDCRFRGIRRQSLLPSFRFRSQRTQRYKPLVWPCDDWK
jgi:hypothetical protein